MKQSKVWVRNEVDRCGDVRAGHDDGMSCGPLLYP